MRPFGPDSPWRLDPDITYLTHGTFGACPEPVLAYQRGLTDRLEARPVQFLDRDLPELLDGARHQVAAFLNADPDGLVVVPNATAGVSTVLRSLRLRPGDELLTTDHEYNAVLNALQAVADDQRARVVRVSIPLPVRHPEAIVEALLSAVNPRTRLAVVSHVTSPTALVLPIASIVRELDRLGVDAIVDAAHAPGMVPIDLGALGAAYWTGNGHKWLCGPKGAGILHVRADRRDLIRPLVTSHGRNDPRQDRTRLLKEFDWQGTPDPTPFLALPEAIRILGALDPGGWDGLMASNRAMALVARERIQAALGVDAIVPDELIGSMAAIRLPTLTTDAEAEQLNLDLYREDHIEVPIIGWPVRGARSAVSDPPESAFVRLSAQRYNEPSDYERLANALVRRGLASGRALDGTRASAIVGG
jgi:isopenicillin-N epimerase